MKVYFWTICILMLLTTGCSNTRLFSKTDNPPATHKTKGKSKKNKETAEAAEQQQRLAIVTYAEKFLGAKYEYGGRGPSRFDCSGFTSYVLRHFNIDIPPTSSTQSTKGKRITPKQADPGDLVFFGANGRVGHVALVTHNTGNALTVIHSTSSRGVRKDEIYGSEYWNSRLLWVVDTFDTYVH